MKKLLIASFAALVLTGCGNASAPGSTLKEAVANEAAIRNAKMKAVLVYADWCSSCKVLDPAIMKARDLSPMPGVEFVVLDYTDKNEANFYAQAEAAGIEPAIRTYLDGTVKTGLLLLVDLDDGKVIQKITKADTAPAILSKIKDAITDS